MHPRFRFVLLCFFLFTAAPVAAQLDTTFVERFTNNARVNTGLRYRNKSASFATAAGEEFKLESQDLSFRLGGRYKFLSYTFSFPISDLGTGTDEEMGTSFGLGLTLFMRQQLLHTSFRNTKGFRSEDPDKVSVFREDVSLFQSTIFCFHVLNNRKYSLRASFKQRDRQLKSAGSILLGGLIDRQRLRTPLGISIPLTNGDQSVITRYAQTKLGIGIGYGHTWIFGDHWFLTPMAIVGPEFRFIAFDELDMPREREDLHVSPRFRGHLGFGWNGYPLAVGLSVIYLPSLDATETLDQRTVDLSVELRITRRF